MFSNEAWGGGEPERDSARLLEADPPPPRLWSCPSEVEDARAYTCGLLERYASKDLRTGRTHMRRAAIRPGAHKRFQRLVARTFARVDAEAGYGRRTAEKSGRHSRLAPRRSPARRRRRSLEDDDALRPRMISAVAGQRAPSNAWANECLLACAGRECPSKLGGGRRCRCTSGRPRSTPGSVQQRHPEADRGLVIDDTGRDLRAARQIVGDSEFPTVVRWTGRRYGQSNCFRVGTGTILRFHRVCHDAWV